MSNLSSNLSTYKIPFQQGRGQNSSSAKNRLINIEFCESLPRDNLTFNQKERQILLYTTCQNERIFIQYPGKESQTKNPKPWDFRPKLLKSDESYLHDLSFANIWNSLYDTFIHLPNKDELLRLLATEFYRMAFMIDYEERLEKSEYLAREIEINSSEYFEFFKLKSEKSLLLFKPNKDIIDILSQFSPKILEVSWEAFLIYNDLLAFNEDCKYFYIGEYLLDKKNGLAYIAPGVGRINTLLTHISVIGFILGEVKFADILMKASRTRGVSPANNKELRKIIGNYFEN